LTMIHRDVALADRLRSRLMDLADRCFGRRNRSSGDAAHADGDRPIRLIVRQLEVLRCVAVGMSIAQGP
jgi:hypothetical protein